MRWRDCGWWRQGLSTLPVPANLSRPHPALENLSLAAYPRHSTICGESGRATPEVGLGLHKRYGNRTWAGRDKCLPAGIRIGVRYKKRQGHKVGQVSHKHFHFQSVNKSITLALISQVPCTTLTLISTKHTTPTTTHQNAVLHRRHRRCARRHCHCYLRQLHCALPQRNWSSFRHSPLLDLHRYPTPIHWCCRRQRWIRIRRCPRWRCRYGKHCPHSAI